MKQKSNVVLIAIIVMIISSCVSNNTKSISSRSHVQRSEVDILLGRNKQSNKNKQKIKVPLTVIAPLNSRIRIMNIVPKYTDAILLEKGRYDVQVSKPGYQTFRKWIEVSDEKSLTVDLERNSSPSIVANGSFVWESYFPPKNDPYNYPVRNFDGHLWLNTVPKDRYGRGRRQSWAGAKKYCDELSINIKGVNFDDFEMPSENSLKTLWRYRGYSSYYIKKPGYSRVWSNITTYRKSMGHLAKMFNLEDGRYSGWYHSGVRPESHPTVARSVCVSKKRINSSHLGLIDFKKNRDVSVQVMANELFISKSQYLSNPSLASYPKNISYKKFNKKEFETTIQFDKRVGVHKNEVDIKNRKKNELWARGNDKIKQNFREDLKSFKENKKTEYINALSMAFHIKYGRPVIKSSNYDADRQVMSVNLVSSRSNYNKHLKIPVKLKYAKEFKGILSSKGFSPKVEMIVVKNQLKFSAIAQIKDPTILVEENEYNKSFKSAQKLLDFLDKYPGSKLRKKAEDRISKIGGIVTLQAFVENHPNSEFKQSAEHRISELQEEIRLEKQREGLRQKIRAREAEERERQRQEKARRKIESYSTQKHVGEKICKDYSGIFSVTLEGYVESQNGNKIQIRISDSDPLLSHDYPYNGLVWEIYSLWRHCDY